MDPTRLELSRVDAGAGDGLAFAVAALEVPAFELPAFFLVALFFETVGAGSFSVGSLRFKRPLAEPDSESISGSPSKVYKVLLNASYNLHNLRVSVQIFNSPKPQLLQKLPRFTTKPNVRTPDKSDDAVGYIDHAYRIRNYYSVLRRSRRLRHSQAFRLLI